MKKKISRKTIALLLVTTFLLIGCGKSETGLQQSRSHLGHTGIPGSEATGGYSEDITMEEIKEAIVDILGDNYWPDMEIDAASLEQIYGIDPDMYDDYLAEYLTGNESADTLIIVKAKSDRVDHVEKALNNYLEVNISNSGSYSQEFNKMQAARIETFHNYVCFVQLGANTEAANEIGDEAVVGQCLEENERTLDAIEKALLR